MRCNDCGYDGIENVAGGKCLKCGSQLQGTDSAAISQGAVSQFSQGEQLKRTVVQGNLDMMMAAQQNLKQTVVQGDLLSCSQETIAKTVVQGAQGVEQWNGNATVKDGRESKIVFDGEDDSEIDEEELHEHYAPVVIDGQLQCPKCHYPIYNDDLKSCPNCMADFTGQEEEEDEEKEEEQQESTSANDQQKKKVDGKKALKRTINADNHVSTVDLDADANLFVECENCKKQVSVNFKYCPYCSAEIHQKTIVVSSKRRKKQLKLDEQQKQAEQQPLNLKCHLTILPDEDEQLDVFTHDFEGDHIILNRANTEPNNCTITSKQQAELVNEGGNWYIENCSELGSTFIAVNRRFQLQSGDIIMLGDRRFKFVTDEQK